MDTVVNSGRVIQVLVDNVNNWFGIIQATGGIIYKTAVSTKHLSFSFFVFPVPIASITGTHNLYLVCPER